MSLGRESLTLGLLIAPFFSPLILFFFAGLARGVPISNETIGDHWKDLVFTLPLYWESVLLYLAAIPFVRFIDKKRFFFRVAATITTLAVSTAASVVLILLRSL